VALTILEGSTFCICDDHGDVLGETDGFFSADTRHLSRFLLTINGERPLHLSDGKVEYFSAAFYLRNPTAGGLPGDSLALARSRFVGASMQDRISITNETMEDRSFAVELDVEADFADIFAVKDRDFALGNPDSARPLPTPVDPSWSDDGQIARFEDGDDRTQVLFSQAPDRTDGRLCWRVELSPRARWELVVDVVPDGDTLQPEQQRRRFGEELNHIRESLAAWHLRVPRVEATWSPLERTFRRSVADLAALRMRAQTEVGKLPAAGMPWFMTVFGRDTIITCLQTLTFGPELARTALRVLATMQALEDDPSIDAEPGKIVHEVRQGKAAKRWFPRYYGTLDATPLYLVLLHHVWAWTGDDELVHELREPALRALAWIDEWGDRDGDGFVEFGRRSPRGLHVQSWKDSDDSQRFADGRVAEGLIAPCEVQGYVYDAKRRTAELARLVWKDQALADRLDAQAEALRLRFDDAFWIDSRGGFYALALDGEKRRVDSLTSNIGHLLWSGIVPEERVPLVAAQLRGRALWSGWGVRTMSTTDRAFNPLSYHNGTVWPHDNSLIAWGLARAGMWEDCHRILRAMIEAAEHFAWELPEVFAGIRRAETPFPIAYPTAARPQAWAAGTPVLLLQLLLGLEPLPGEDRLATIAPGSLPEWLGDVALLNVPAFGRDWNVLLSDGRVTVEPR
jgi:glycogen debranching enzyme